jgi:hypothetical protein
VAVGRLARASIAANFFRLQGNRNCRWLREELHTTEGDGSATLRCRIACLCCTIQTSDNKWTHLPDARDCAP